MEGIENVLASAEDAPAADDSCACGFEEAFPFVYLDYAATAPLCEEAASAMQPLLLPGVQNLRLGGNANTLYRLGRSAFSALEDARRSIASDLGAARPDEVLFTSGATESDNAAIEGMAQAAFEARRAKSGAFVPHVIVSAIEHDAVLMPAKRLERQGFRVTRVRPNRDGFICESALERALDSDTVLVSLQAANSEVGSIQPIAALANLAHQAGALFHTDAVQALGKASVNLAEWGVDAASFAAHKIGGPKGIGLLYLKARTPFRAFLEGGGQEQGRRSGTQNVAGAVGFAAALQASCRLLDAETARLASLRDFLYDSLATWPQVQITCPQARGSASYLPNIVHIMVRGFESETLLLRLDELGFAVSGGSACASHSLEPSHVLSAMGVSADDAYGALRISMGRYTTQTDVSRFLEALQEVIRR